MKTIQLLTHRYSSLIKAVDVTFHGGSIHWEIDETRRLAGNWSIWLPSNHAVHLRPLEHNHWNRSGNACLLMTRNTVLKLFEFLGFVLSLSSHNYYLICTKRTNDPSLCDFEPFASITQTEIDVIKHFKLMNNLRANIKLSVKRLSVAISWRPSDAQWRCIPIEERLPQEVKVGSIIVMGVQTSNSDPDR